ncbi:hypothetical protein F5X71_34660 [Nocardia brasiliensis]|uniref:Uncharacterized protein n=2 Tax=Nocardia brasiliensis TaxID=37326 RepID=A0A6G9Y0N6_NOCBR|nr:hypothetical protein F5X71_34660 [Nocardia brasiliensis]
MAGRWEQIAEFTAHCHPAAPPRTLERYARTAAKFEQVRAALYTTGAKPPAAFGKLAGVLAELSEQVGIPTPSAQDWHGDAQDWGAIRGVTHSTGHLPCDLAAILIDRDWRYTADND